jgi:hypothetical protein
MESRERYEKTDYLIKRWVKEQGIDLQLENIAHSIQFLIKSIYDKLPDTNIGELYEAVSNHDDTDNNEDISGH